MKSLTAIIPAFILALFCGVGTAHAQKTPENIKQLIDSQRYVFEAQWVSPMRGPMRSLTSLYTVAVTKDTVAADLPFFGKAYVASINPSDNGISFTSTNFEYSASTIKNGWSITIKPKDGGNGNQLFFTIFNNGSATLQVNSNTREGISFSGYIRAVKK